jgi:hypothetical protein
MAINTFTPDQLQQIEQMLFDRSGGMFQRALSDLADKMGTAGIKGISGIVDLGQALYDESLKQAQEYQENIVGVYGDITTQQEDYGKSMAKLAAERKNELRQDFLQMEAGGVKIMDVFVNMDAAAENALGIIASLAGATGQFTDDLQKQNLTIIQLLQAASGLSDEQTGAIMKIAKGRGEDSKQMLADIGTFSKMLADKFGLDTKMVAQNVAQLTTMTSTFGKVSVEAATVAAAKFEALGVSIEDVSQSLVSTFGNFSGAADAAAKLSQAFGVNIDSMQMMVDVNSGPEGVTRALDNMREAIIGAGIDISELDAPMRRMISEITGIRDDETVESLFDVDRITVETDELMDAARKAAEAQKDPAAAIQMMDKDIAKVYRSMEELSKLTQTQALTRAGVDAANAAAGMAKFGSAAQTAIDSYNQLIMMQPDIDAGMKKAITYIDHTSKMLEESAKTLEALAKNTAEASYGQRIEASKPINYGASQTAGSGVAFDPEYQRVTGYQPGAEAYKNAALDLAVENTAQIARNALGEREKLGAVTPATQQALNDKLAELQQAMLGVGIDITGIMSALGASNAAPDVGVVPAGVAMDASASPAASLQPIVDLLTGGPGGSVVPDVPLSAPPTLPAAAAPEATIAPAPTGAPTAAMSTSGAAVSSTATSSVVARTASAAAPIGRASATGLGPPMTLNIVVNLEAAGTAAALAKFTNIATT